VSVSVFQRWVDKNASEDEASMSSMAPPSDFELSRNNSTANFGNGSASEDLSVKDKMPLNNNNNTLAPPMFGNKSVSSKNSENCPKNEVT
jgi:hypothetical protein